MGQSVQYSGQFVAYRIMAAVQILYRPLHATACFLAWKLVELENSLFLFVQQCAPSVPIILSNSKAQKPFWISFFLCI